MEYFSGEITDVRMVTENGVGRGFHSLVAGGSSSKQLAQEKSNAKIVASGGIVLEAIFAVGGSIPLPGFFLHQQVDEFSREVRVE